MSKYTKVIAALGVAAGLGVASLPLGAFAANPKSVGGTVNVQTTVPDVLTMVIDSSAETEADDPAAEITSGISDIAIGTDGKIEAGKSGTSGTDKTVIVINTNQPNGYDFKVVGTDLKNKAADTTLIGSIAPFTTAKKLVSGTGTDLADETNEGWGINVAVSAKKMKDDGSEMEAINDYAISGAANFAATDGSDLKYYMPKDNAETIDKMAAKSVKAQREVTYTISYGANVAKGKPAGEYKGTCTYTATAQ